MDTTPGGWVPYVEDATALAQVIDQAFDYRGDVTVVLHDETEWVGYVFNRNCEVLEPYLQMFESTGGSPVTLPYARIRTIRFTGKDTAAGNSYAAWRERKAAARPPKSSVPDA